MAGPVFAAAVILPKHFDHPLLDDSKKLSEDDRYSLRPVIEREALAWAVAHVSPLIIDRINILQASILAMHKALDQLKVRPTMLLVDGNRFKPYQNIPHQTIVEGDAKYMSIAAASILAKTYRDEFMEKLHEEYPMYDWKSNKGYGTQFHRNAMLQFGSSPYHRRTFVLKELQMELFVK